MDVDELKADLAAANDEALRLADELASAVERGDLEFAQGVAVNVRFATRRVKNLRRTLALEVAG